jgi:hypothetical protein
MASPRLRDLAPETDQPRTQGLLSSTTWLNGTVVTETEVARSLGGAGWLQSKISGDTRGDMSHGMVRLGFTGTAGSVRYGALYRSAEQGFLNGPDLAIREAWGEWKSGMATLRTAIGQQWNNVAGEATRSRLEQTYERIGLAWKRPALPEVTLTYSHNALASTLNPLGITPQHSYNHTLEGALVYNSLHWNTRLASSYSLGSDLMHGGTELTVRLQTFTAIFRPLNTLTIVPTLGYREELQGWSGVRINSPSASLAVQYRQSQQVLLSAMGNYIATQSSDQALCTGQVGGKGILVWDLQRSESWATLLSFEAGYNRLTNRAIPSAETEDISGLIRLVVAAL